MSHDLTIASIKLASCTVPDDGDAVVASAFVTPYQQLANAVQWANDAIDNGKLAVTAFVNSAALKAYTAPVQDQLAYVRGLGVLVYDTQSTQPETPPYVYIPNSAPGAGRWRHVLAESVTYTGGAGGNAIRLFASVPNQIVDVVQAVNSATYTLVPDGSYHDTGANGGAITLNAGDIVVVDVTTTLSNGNTNNPSVHACLAVLDPASVVTAFGNSVVGFWPNRATNIAADVPLHLRYKFTALLSGAHVFGIQLQAAANASSSISIGGPTNWTQMIIRP